MDQKVYFLILQLALMLHDEENTQVNTINDLIIELQHIKDNEVILTSNDIEKLNLMIRALNINIYNVVSIKIDEINEISRLNFSDFIIKCIKGKSLTKVRKIIRVIVNIINIFDDEKHDEKTRMILEDYNTILNQFIDYN
jgi:hypothetical protein